MAFEAGDIVQLKSGSPALTVVAVEGEIVSLVWYADETGEFRTQKIPAIALEALDLIEFDEDEEDEEGDSEEE